MKKLEKSLFSFIKDCQASPVNEKDDLFKLGFVSDESILKLSSGVVNNFAFTYSDGSLYSKNIFSFKNILIPNVEENIDVESREFNKEVVGDEPGISIEDMASKSSFGHINLPIGLVNTRYTKLLSLLLDVEENKLDSIIHYKDYYVTTIDDLCNKGMTILSEEDMYKADIFTDEFYQGAKAISILINNMDFKEEYKKCNKNSERYSALKFICDNNIDVNNVIYNVIPVVPVVLRWNIEPDGEQNYFNVIYRRIINRCNRYRVLIGQKAPRLITSNEARMIQKAFDELLEYNIYPVNSY